MFCDQIQNNGMLLGYRSHQISKFRLKAEISSARVDFENDVKLFREEIQDSHFECYLTRRNKPTFLSVVTTRARYY